MSLRDEILALGMSLDDHGAIAEQLSAGRKKLVPTEIGNGLILETIGIDAGNQLLDAINAADKFRYVQPLLAQGRLRIDSDMVRTSLDELVGASVISADDALKLKNLAVVADPVTSQDVTRALEGYGD